MRIDKLEIKNFKGFDNKTFEFPAQFTVIIGENATGKTSVLEALCVAVGSVFIDIGEKLTRTINNKTEIRQITINNQPKPQKPVSIEAWGKIDNSKQVYWKRDIPENGIKTSTKNAKELRKIIGTKIRLSRNEATANSVLFPIIAYYSTARLWAEHEKVKEDQIQGEGIKMAYQNCLSAKSSSKEFFAWFKTQEDSVYPLRRTHIELFKKIINDLLPEENNWQNIHYERADNDLVGVFTDTKGNTNHLRYSQLSDGYRNIIGLAADIAYRCIQLNPHLGENAVIDTPGVVLIDELDLHLHPNWQKRIVGDLKRTFPKIQFVATTHSPFIVQSLKEDELINLNENEGIDGDFFKRSVEDIAAYEMGVKDVQRSKLFLEMQKEAKEFFELVQNNSDETTLKIAKQKLDELRVLFSTADPAYIALLQTELSKES